MSKNKTLNLISLGCAKNLVDSEILLGGLNKTDITLTHNPDGEKYVGEFKDGEYHGQGDRKSVV